MTKRIRSIIFLVFLIVFLLAAPITILYSLGYRLDPQKTKLVQTGGLFLKAVPSSTDIYVTPLETKKTKVIGSLTGQTKTFHEKTGLFQGSVFVKNLFPQKYTVKIEKQGFYAWEKNLEISEGIVTEAKDVILIPENPSFELLSQEVKNFWFLPNQKHIVLEKVSGDLELFDIKDKESSPLIQKTIPEGSLSLSFSTDSKKALVIVKRGWQNIFYILPIQEEPTQLVPLDFLGLNIEKVSFNPKNSDEIFFSKQFPEGKFVFSSPYVEKETSAEPILADFLTYKIDEKQIIWLDNKGFLLRRGISDRDIEHLNPEKPFNLSKYKEYQIISDTINILLKEDNRLYFFDKDSKEFIMVSEDIKVFEFSPEHKKITLLKDYELWVLFLEEQKHQPYRNKMSKIFLAKPPEQVSQCSWFSTQYLIFVSGNKVKISEIDDRDKINIVEITTPPSPAGLGGVVEKIFFNYSNKKLYILVNNTLYSSEKPLR